MCNGNTERFCATNITGERTILISCAMRESRVGSWSQSRRTTSSYLKCRVLPRAPREEANQQQKDHTAGVKSNIEAKEGCELGPR